MTNDWVLDVLADLRLFASRNGLSALADHLEDTARIAAAEIATMEAAAPPQTPHDEIAGRSRRRLAANTNS